MGAIIKNKIIKRNTLLAFTKSTVLLLENSYRIASKTTPKTSSSTAAPSTISPSLLWRFFKSFNTLIVIPMLVAVIVPPTNRETTRERLKIVYETHAPSTKGIRKPPIATIAAFQPLCLSLLISVSIPTSKSNSIIPISFYSFMVLLGSTHPSNDGPKIIPASSSPRTGGIASF